MNYTLYISIQEDQYNQMLQAVEKVNALEGKKPCVGVSISRIFPAKGQPPLPAMIELKIHYKDLYSFFWLAKYFGIILEKVNPQQL